MEPAEARLLLVDLAATHRLGARIAGRLAPGSVVLLQGDLGSGKSELARAVIRTLAGEPIQVPSPTFTLLQTYALPALEVGHADLYRLVEPGEVAELALEESWCQGALLVEWPERAPAFWPDERLTVTLSAQPGDPPSRRMAHLVATGRWSELLPGLAEGFATD
jgi:tRNA threonylcarbamoyl adenosine modification protein YjeE